jgi:hypothetical protein
MLLTSTNNTKECNKFGHDKLNSEMKCAMISPAMNLSMRNVNTMPPEYSAALPSVSLNLRDLNDVQPFFLTDRQTPKMVSMNMAIIATKTNGLHWSEYCEQ